MLTVHAYVEVTDLERGITFYRDALGLTLIEKSKIASPCQNCGDKSKMTGRG